MHAYRTHNCGALTKENIGETVRLSGWIHRKRDHGGVLFVDLRDHYGMTQVVAKEGSEWLDLLDHMPNESVLTVTGEVVYRGDDAVNPKLATGEIEVVADDVVVQSRAKELPLPVAGEQEYPEDIRLKYRFLDLRRETLHKNIMTRVAVVSDMRERMKAAGFNEFSTPILTASSPEGARDFLVPSRIHAGKFYALPQAPQQYKQLLMVAGFDRYFQIAPCFRDEDPRADRLPGEFYQLDLELVHSRKSAGATRSLRPTWNGIPGSVWCGPGWRSACPRARGARPTSRDNPHTRSSAARVCCSRSAYRPRRRRALPARLREPGSPPACRGRHRRDRP